MAAVAPAPVAPLIVGDRICDIANGRKDIGNARFSFLETLM
ncbi:MAG: hypothetical protein WKF84_14510 [Pyrinomonadaceae bacterium]